MPQIPAFVRLGNGQNGAAFVAESVNGAVRKRVGQHPALIVGFDIEVVKMHQQRVFFVFRTVVGVGQKPPLLHQKSVLIVLARRAEHFFGGHALGVKTEVETRIDVLAKIEIQHVLVAPAQHEIHPGKR